MSRYKNTNISKDKKGFNKFDTTLYESIPKNNNDMYVITQEGDRLDTLAFEYYGDQHLWWFIARANNLKSMNVAAGTRLRIPTSTENAKSK